MSEKETLFSTKFKYVGILSFKSVYKFCYDWLVDETGMLLTETKYVEKLKGESRDLDLEWEGFTKFTDYFRFDIKVTMQILGLKEVEITKDGKKYKTNEGSFEMRVKGTLVRDWQGKFEKNGFQKFLRAIYEKWIIPTRVDQFEGKIIGDCDEFLGETKAFLALEGKVRH